MREIKFRAWHKAHQRMYYSDFVVKFTGTLLWWVSEHGYDELMGTDKAIPMQFTGLKDKNGKEIYEGDVVEELEDSYYSIEEDDDREVLGKFVIEYDVNGFWPKHRESNEYGWGEDDAKDNFRVIGNIYENPELIETK
jgi:uncharacterized phage protein (TIGR01671 family)